MTRQEAIVLNSVTYNGKECSKGHGTLRYVKSCGCVECLKIQTLNRDPSVFKKYATSEKGKATKKQYRKTDVYKKVQNNYQRKDYHNNKEWYQNNQLIRTYGITLNQYNELLLNQQYKCAICEKHIDQQNKRMCVDHCHNTNKIRSLLCNPCNTALGLLYENTEIMNKMIKYVELHDD